MVTFLVHFGFQPRYVLSSDLLTVEGMYESAMRCTYLDKTEDLISAATAYAECQPRKKGSKGPLMHRIKDWAKITRSETQASADPVAGLMGFVGKMKR